MNSVHLDEAQSRSSRGLLPRTAEIFVDARQFRALMVSHRRMVRADKVEAFVKGLRDLDTGEIFLIDERRLFDAKR